MTNNDKSVKDLIIKARKEVLINKNYFKALISISEIEKTNALNDEEKLFLKNTAALAYLENKEYNKAAELYKEINENYQAGFCELLLGNEQEAERLWHNAPDAPACQWGKCLLDFIKLKKGKKPTFFQIRNHLETDIGYFIQANRIKYTENLIKHDELFMSVNLESYKLIGRTLLNYGFFNMARKYLLKSLQILPNEAETLYFLGRYYYLTGAYRECQITLGKCLESNFDYTPARELLAKTELKLDNIW
ncbi:MAG TPA: hypothetical protein P5556_04825 [Candidatus Gastranaerophilales bacterium]|nr:hypothetical protein [Candidatus Gastranaerophilales bacterium]